MSFDAALILQSSLIDLVIWSLDVIALNLDLGIRSSVHPAQFAYSDGNKTLGLIRSFGLRILSPGAIGIRLGLML